MLSFNFAIRIDGPRVSYVDLNRCRVKLDPFDIQDKVYIV